MKIKITKEEYEKKRKELAGQLASLGSGNHFIEIQKGSDGHIWIMIHSGSRNVGLKIADYYNKLAIKLNEKWRSSVPKEWQLAFLPVDSDEGQAYLKEMNYAVEFALANRKLMMDRVIESFRVSLIRNKMVTIMDTEPMINIAHNYASLENHFGENVWVHRKGATLARKGTIGIIPGSMGTKSYIVEGLGNSESFESCSHGAGRKMSRKEAIKSLVLKDEQEKMKEIIGAPRTQNDLEEAPGAYKDIDEVMENQKDLVKILVELTPLAVIKG
ncbi:MAG: RtcB family protein [Candidatus Portnoybacteria bacterium]|nr:RtcB family protein [Candidatus Portnoybacteria bacterium]